MTQSQPERPWIGILVFGLGVALLAVVLSPNEAIPGLIIGFFGGILIALGLTIILRTSRG